MGARLAHLRTAWDEYMQQFDPCRCAPCRHNGLPVLTGTSCKCLCKSGYQGEACEETRRRGETQGRSDLRLFYTYELNCDRLNSTTRQTPRQTGPGPAGAAGRPARRGGKPGQEPATTPPPMVEEPPAGAPLLTLGAARRTFHNSLSFISEEMLLFGI